MPRPPARSRGRDFPTASLTMPRLTTAGVDGHPVLAHGVQLVRDDNDPHRPAQLLRTSPAGRITQQELDRAVTVLLDQCTGTNTVGEVITATVTALLGPAPVRSASAGTAIAGLSEPAALASGLSDLIASLVTAGILRFA